MALEHKGEVTGVTVEDRVEQTSLALRREGIVDGWAKDSEGFRISNSACPYRQTAELSHGPCELDRHVIELLVSAPVRQVSRIVDGRHACEYLIADSGERTEEE